MNEIKHKLEFENVWRKNIAERKEITTIWKQFHPGLEEKNAEERLNQIVILVKNEFGQIVGISSAFKAYIKQLDNYFYSARLILIPGYRIPGLMSKLMVMTRDFLESVHRHDDAPPCLGIVLLVENDRLKKLRNEAIWPASQFVYIGNSGKGHHIRVYYFKGALINP